ncbi:MAG: GtrA family protein [Rhodobacteraceae bacterium]|jgi:putative flippase GtrA|nr:GtrA family protein [Paracoccaceae bacterium]
MTPERPHPRTRDLARFIRFAIVGAGFALGYAVVTAVLVGRAGLPPLATSVVVYALCIPLAYLAQRSFAFRVRRAQRGGFGIYAATQVACLALVSVVTSRFVTGHVATDTALFLVTAGAAAVASYAVLRLVVFRPEA